MRKILILLFTTFLLVSCSKKNDIVVIEKDFVNEEWSRFEFLNGEIQVEDASSEYDIVMHITVSDIYPNTYENHQDDSSLLFNMTIKNAENGFSRSKDYKFYLKDKDGNWKADKSEGYYTFKLPVIEGINFSDQGAYTFKIENKYPKDPLYGVKSLTLKCIKSKK